MVSRGVAWRALNLEISPFDFLNPKFKLMKNVSKNKENLRISPKLFGKLVIDLNARQTKNLEHDMWTK
jgi:hypothetical protein